MIRVATLEFSLFYALPSLTLYLFSPSHFCLHGDTFFIYFLFACSSEQGWSHQHSTMTYLFTASQQLDSQTPTQQSTGLVCVFFLLYWVSTHLKWAHSSACGSDRQFLVNFLSEPLKWYANTLASPSLLFCFLITEPCLKVLKETGNNYRGIPSPPPTKWTSL